MIYKSEDIAKYVLTHCFILGIDVTGDKLQGILYFLYGTYYNLYGEELFEEEFEAWPQGPVLKDLYLKYSIFETDPIPPYENYYKMISGKDYEIDLVRQINKSVDKFGIERLSKISEILEMIVEIDEEDLTTMRIKDKPWKVSFPSEHKCQPMNNLIKEHFKKEVNEDIPIEN